MILVAAALKKELHPFFESEDVIYTGIGKINASFFLTKALKNSEIGLVVNFGTAASAQFPKGTIVQCNRIYERDMECQLIEYVKENPPYIDLKDFLIPSLNRSACYTGDSFLNYFQVQKYDGVVDMEAFALAKVCQYLSIPFVSIKAVTDGLNFESEAEWRESINDSAKQFREIYAVIKTMYQRSS